MLELARTERSIYLLESYRLPEGFCNPSIGEDLKVDLISIQFLDTWMIFFASSDPIPSRTRDGITLTLLKVWADGRVEIVIDSYGVYRGCVSSFVRQEQC